jgi:signal peptide peptidase SppA
MGLAIDASCDLPQDFLQQHDIAVMPIAVKVDKSTFKDDRDPAEIERFLKLDLGSRSHSAETEPCSVDDVQKLFLDKLVLEKDCVFCLTITAGRSAIYDNVVKASFAVLKNYRKVREPAGITGPFLMRVLDTRSLFVGSAPCVAEAVRLIQANETPAAIRERLAYVAENSYGYMLPRDLYYLRARAKKKGDRSVGLLSAVLGSTLDIKPLLRGYRGETTPVGKVRGWEHGCETLFSYAAVVPDRDKPGASAVTVVVAEGEISGGQQSAGSIGGESTAALVRSARENKRTKALVLRVNSPGGEVYAAEEIRREVALTRKAGIPVVVSMGDVAASGGYWISMNADQIYAEPNTITGSIGIFGMFFTVPGTLGKLGITSDGVSTAPLAGAFNITRPLDPKVGAVIQSIIDKGYRDFVGGVAKARGKDYSAIDAIAQGRVWTGSQAQQRGLVDQLGGLDAAIQKAADLAKLGKHYAVRYQEQPKGAFERFVVSLNQSAMASSLQSYGLKLPSWFAQLQTMAPELEMLRTAQAGHPNVYAYCFCSPQ